MLADLMKKFMWWNRPFDCFEVFPNLFQGNQIQDNDDIQKIKSLKIKSVIDLEGGFDPPMGFLDSYLYWPILDLPVLPDLEDLFCITAFCSHVLQSKRRVLIHCKQGLNRSGLVCGRVMYLMGMKGPDILKAINEKIPSALWNPVFREYVRGL